MIDLHDVYPGEGLQKVAQALQQFSLKEVQTEADFDIAYDTLHQAFGPIGELERREVLYGWLVGSRSPQNTHILAHYHIILAYDADGSVAGVRDCGITLDLPACRVVALLSHSLVLPPYRRTGLAALLRTAPAVLAKRAAQAAHLDPQSVDILLATEMDPVSATDKNSVIRLLAYGRAGFRVIPPTILPYAQPDFRDVETLGVDAVPIPLLPIVRQVDHEDRQTISKAQAKAFVTHFQAAQSSDCLERDLIPIRQLAFSTLDAYDNDPITLHTIPSDVSQIKGFWPLLRGNVLPLYPETWRGNKPILDPEHDMKNLIATWSLLASPKENKRH